MVNFHSYVCLPEGTCNFGCIPVVSDTTYSEMAMAISFYCLFLWGYTWTINGVLLVLILVKDHNCSMRKMVCAVTGIELTLKCFRPFDLSLQTLEWISSNYGWIWKCLGFLFCATGLGWFIEYIYISIYLSIYIYIHAIYIYTLYIYIYIIYLFLVV